MLVIANNYMTVQVADIRIYTTNREKVMKVINGAKLLQNPGRIQVIKCN